MKQIARGALVSGMEIAEDVYGLNQTLLAQKGDKVDSNMMVRFVRHGIVSVPVKDVSEHAKTHYEFIHGTNDFQRFNQVYQRNLTQYKSAILNLVQNQVSIPQEFLLQLHQNVMSSNPSKEAIIDFLYNMVPSEDDVTHTHCFNSAIIADIFGEWLGMSLEQRQLLVLCGYYYDIGKLKLPPSLFWKQEKLTDLEFTRIKTHTMLGFEIIKNEDLPSEVFKATLTHHERCDGSGYPSHLKGDQLSVYSKMIAIVDTYEAMTSARTYRKTLTPFEVIENFEQKGYEKYEAMMLRPILRKIAKAQVGISVVLNDGKVGNVLYINENALSRPILQVNNEIYDLNLYKGKSIIALH